MTGHNGPVSAVAIAPGGSWLILILALPVMIFGIVGFNRAMGSVGYGIGGTLFTLALLGIPVALIAKLFRWLRRRSSRSRNADSQKPR